MAEQQVAPTVARAAVTADTRRRGVDGDRLFKGVATFFAALVLIAAAIMVITIFVSARDAFAHVGLGILTGSVWDPQVKHIYGALPFIFGTVLTSLLALLLAGVVGIGVALLLVELKLPRRPTAVLSFLVELLAAIPSIVYGVWGVFVLIPIMQGQVNPFLHRVLGWTPFFGADSGAGRNLLTASLVLAIMIVPTVTAISRDVIRVVPDNQREAMLALGATRWEMIWKAVLPSARPGIIGALILALGRAVGETIAATMVIGNTAYIGPNLLNGGNTLASVIANSFGDAATDTLGLELPVLFELGVILFLVSVFLNAMARVLVWTVSRGMA